MKKNEYLAQLSSELKKMNIEDASDIVSEYEQHFAFKMADGFTEEEISAKLGDPIALASNFEARSAKKENGGRKVITVIGLYFADFFMGILLVLLFAWEAIMAALSIACAVVAVCFLARLNAYLLIPYIPYWCGAVFAISMAALAVLAAVGCIYFAAFIRQLTRSYRRFHHNTIAFAYGKAALPGIAIHPQFSAKVNRRIRTTALLFLIVFAVGSVLGAVLSMISSGSIEFWHIWGWFV